MKQGTQNQFSTLKATDVCNDIRPHVLARLANSAIAHAHFGKVEMKWKFILDIKICM